MSFRRDSDYEDDQRSSNRKISVDEADEILEEARSKDFWAVDFSYDNRGRLQDAIDRVYNTIMGNNYEVDYMNNQNGSRLIIRCVTCQKELTSFDPFITHEKGKPHKKVRQQQLSPRDPNLKGTLKRQSHNKVKGIFPPKSLEDRVDYCDEPVLGMQFVYREDIRGKEMYTCQLCQMRERVTRLGTKSMFKHVKSKSHLKLYMDVKFGNTKTVYSKFSEIVEDTEKFEGKIHANVVDFTKQYLAEEIQNIKQEIKQEVAIKREQDLKLEIKRERSSSSDSSDYDRGSSRHRNDKKSRTCNWSDRSSDDNRAQSPALENRALSPDLFRVKEEPMSPPVLSNPYPPSPEFTAPLPPPRPVLADKSTLTDAVPRTKSLNELVEDARILQSVEAYDQLLEDRDMQNLMAQTLIVLNKELYNYFKEANTICWDEKGRVVNKAADCAMGLETKHLTSLEVLSRVVQ